MAAIPALPSRPAGHERDAVISGDARRKKQQENRQDHVSGATMVQWWPCQRLPESLILCGFPVGQWASEAAAPGSFRKASALTVPLRLRANMDLGYWYTSNRSCLKPTCWDYRGGLNSFYHWRHLVIKTFKNCQNVSRGNPCCLLNPTLAVMSQKYSPLCKQPIP